MDKISGTASASLGKGGLSKIASGVAVPVMADECTTKKLRVSYARVLIDVDITQPKKEFIEYVDIDGVKKSQHVVYEWLPRFCEKCQKIGHTCKNEKKSQQAGKEATKEVWVPKNTQMRPTESEVGVNLLEESEVQEELFIKHKEVEVQQPLTELEPTSKSVVAPQEEGVLKDILKVHKAKRDGLVFRRNKGGRGRGKADAKVP